MDSRREFLKASAAALTVAATRPLFGASIQGANDRVRMAIIGTGNRGGRVFDSFCRQKDCQFAAKGKQVVQVGTHQRSWDHFMEAKKLLDSGAIGNVTQVLITQPGSYARPKEAEAPVPPGLDWDMWQGPAPKKPFKPSRLGFRAWYDYGGGLVADWGAHHVDVAHWFMNADHKAPLRTMANGAFLAVPDADSEQVPDSFSISWQYENFIMSFANGEVYMTDGIENWGVFFVGNRGSLQVNRQGWAVRPVVPHVVRKQGPAPQAGAGGVTLGA